MTLTLLQTIAASALIETIEKQCRDGIHNEQEEMRLRQLTVKACRVFEMPSLAERPPAANDSSFDALISRVEQALNPQGAA